MADEPIPAVIAPVVVAEPAPVVAPAAPEPKLTLNTPVTSTAPLEPDRPRVADVPVVEVKPAEVVVAEAPKVEEVAKSAADEPTLLEEAAGKIGKEDPPKVEEKPKEAVAKPAEAGEEPKKEGEEPKAAEFQAVEYKYELPKDTQLGEEERGKFHSVIDGIRKDPANLQPLIDFHTEVVNKVADQIRKGQNDSFLDTRRAWQKLIRGDAVLGGSGFETAKVVVAEGRDFFVSGRMGPTEIAPAKQGPAPRGVGSRMSALYDNPTSPANKG